MVCVMKGVSLEDRV